MNPSVLVVDDHPIVAEALRSALERAESVGEVVAAHSLAEARTALAARAFDVVLLDWRMPDGSGIDLLPELGDAEDVSAAIMLASYGSPQHVDAALRLGARGYLLKTAPLDDIVRAIGIVADGGLAFSAEQLTAVRRSGWLPLSARERSLIELVVDGRSNEEIAVRLRVSTKVIEAGLGRLYARFGLSTRTELAVAAERGAWLELPPASGSPGRR